MPSIRGTPSIEETRAVANALFHNFCRERFQELGDGVEEQLENIFNDDVQSAGDGYANALWASIGRDLRRIAEEVDKSCERERIRRRASEIDIGCVTYDQFCQLLRELFTRGIDRTRIVVLFFFCTDVAIRAYYSYPHDYCFRLLRWSLRYILDIVCNWVQEHGGWAVVLGTYVYKTIVASVLVLVGISCAIYIKKNIWSSRS